MDYLVIGAGPAGLQLGRFLHQANRDYLILEAGTTPGTSYRRFPHRRRMGLVGGRASWAGAGMEDDAEVPPDPDDYVRYLTDFATAHRLKIRYGARVTRVARDDDLDQRFVVVDQSGQIYRARRVIVATGLGRPYLPPIPGIESAERYDEVEVNPDDFTDQRVLIIGKGDTAFATAADLAGRAAVVHVVGPRVGSATRVAHLTDLTGRRWARNEIFLEPERQDVGDAVLDVTIRQIERVAGDNGTAGGGGVVGRGGAVGGGGAVGRGGVVGGGGAIGGEHGGPGEPGRFLVALSHARHAGGGPVRTIRLHYDRVIACTGFQMDSTIFDATCRPEPSLNGRLPALTSEWESVNVPDLYFAGTLTRIGGAKEHGGAFLHGLRYCMRALRRMLDRKYEGIEWPYRELPADPESLTAAVLTRINRSPGLFQRYAALCDLIVVPPYATLARYYEEMPVDYVHDSLFGSADRYFTVSLEHGDASVPPDPLEVAAGQAGDPDEPYDDRYLRPVIRRYHRWSLVAVQRLPEDIDNDWASEEEYQGPLRFFFAHHMALALV